MHEVKEFVFRSATIHTKIVPDLLKNQSYELVRSLTYYDRTIGAIFLFESSAFDST